MTQPELTTANTSETFDTLICVVNKAGLPGLLVGRVPESHSIATRLVACWNACRAMDDPAKDIADLRSELSHGLSRLSTENDMLRAEVGHLRSLADDPVAEIAKLREGNQSLLQKLSEKDDPYLKNQDGEITRLNNLVAERDRTIARLKEHIERMEEHIETEAQIAAGVHGPVQVEPTPEHLAYQLLRSLILSSAK